MNGDLDHFTLAELHERIIALERDNGFLKKQIGLLNARLTDLGKAFKADVTHNTDSHIAIYQYLTDIHDQLWPLVDKVFPGSHKTRQQIAAVVKNGGRSWDEKNSS